MTPVSVAAGSPRAGLELVAGGGLENHDTQGVIPRSSMPSILYSRYCARMLPELGMRRRAWSAGELFRPPADNDAIDIAPTIYELLSVPLPDGKTVDGTSVIAPELRGAKERPIFARQAL